MYTRAKQLIIILSFLSSDAYAQKAKVSGDIVGLDESTLEVNYAIGNSFKIDEIAVKNGKFTWEADMPYPQKVYIMIPQQHRNIEFYAESGNIKLIGNADSLDKVKIIGSKTQDEWDDFKKSLKDIIYGLETPLYNRNNKGTKEQNIAMEKKLDELRMEIRKKVDLYYITAHPKSAISVSLVSESSFGGYNNLKTLYNLLDTSAQQTIVGKQIANRLIVLKHGNLGERMLDFTQNNTEGNPVR
ncbi:MAG: DUF4369 domain-containing protein, partial [Ferruginibacter sp.]